MNLVLEIRCSDCGHVLGTKEISTDNKDGLCREFGGNWTLKMQPTHACAKRKSLVQKNVVEASITTSKG